MKRADLEQLLAEATAPERRAFRLAGAMAFAATIAAVVLLGLSGWFITGAALAGLGGIVAVQAFNYLLPSAMIRLLAIIRTIVRYGERLYGHRAALMVLASVRARLFDHILTAQDVRAVSAGEAVGRLVQDIGALEDRLVRKPAMPAAVGGSLIGLVFAWFASPLACAALCLVIAAIVMWAHFVAPRLLMTAANDMAAAQARLKAAMIDYAAASPEIFAYDLAPVIERSLEVETSELDMARRRFARGEAIVDAALALGGGVAMAVILLLSHAALPITILAVLAAAGTIEALAAYVRGISRQALVTAALNRLGGMTESASDSDVSCIEQARVPPVGRVITFERGGQHVRLEAGTRLAIRGRSGTGKTSLIETLAGIRLPGRECNIHIDEQPLHALPPENVRALFALSPQDAHLLSGTIRDNLRVARKGLSDEALWDALETACLSEDVQAMPLRLDQWVGDSGARLSGGQRKRFSVARALLAQRPWLLLDEPGEGLDRETESRLVSRLDSWLRRTGAGLVVVSHRPEFLELADQILDIERKY